MSCVNTHSFSYGNGTFQWFLVQTYIVIMCWNENSAQQHTPNKDNSVNSYVLSAYIIIDKIKLQFSHKMIYICIFIVNKCTWSTVEVWVKWDRWSVCDRGRWRRTGGRGKRPHMAPSFCEHLPSLLLRVIPNSRTSVVSIWFCKLQYRSSIRFILYERILNYYFVLWILRYQKDL